MLPSHVAFATTQFGHNLEFLGVLDVGSTITRSHADINFSLAKSFCLENEFIGLDFKICVAQIEFPNDFSVVGILCN